MRQELKSKFTSYWEYLALRTACQLDLFDHVQSGNTSEEEIAFLTGGQRAMLGLLLNALVSINALEKTEHGYALTEMGGLLTGSHPASLKQAAILWGSEQMSAWQSLEMTIKTGRPAFEVLFGKPFFAFLENHPEKLRNYHFAMNEYAIEDYRDLGSRYDFSFHKKLMDVGGGLGALLQSICPRLSNVELILFERPKVLELSRQIAGIRKTSGDFFETLPTEVDGIILSRVLHDWADIDAKRILRNCYEALTEGGYLYVIENITDRMEDSAALLTLNMAVICKSFERDLHSYQKLMEESGFESESEVQVNPLQWMLIYRK